MKFNIWFDLSGPTGKIESVPNNTNPVESENLEFLLRQLVDKMPNIPSLGVKVIGIQVKEL